MSSRYYNPAAAMSPPPLPPPPPALSAPGPSQGERERLPPVSPSSPSASSSMMVPRPEDLPMRVPSSSSHSGSLSAHHQHSSSTSHHHSGSSSHPLAHAHPSQQYTHFPPPHLYSPRAAGVAEGVLEGDVVVDDVGEDGSRFLHPSSASASGSAMGSGSARLPPPPSSSSIPPHHTTSHLHPSERIPSSSAPHLPPSHPPQTEEQPPRPPSTLPSYTLLLAGARSTGKSALARLLVESARLEGVRGLEGAYLREGANIQEDGDRGGEDGGDESGMERKEGDGTEEDGVMKEESSPLDNSKPSTTLDKPTEPENANAKVKTTTTKKEKEKKEQLLNARRRARAYARLQAARAAGFVEGCCVPSGALGVFGSANVPPPPVSSNENNSNNAFDPSSRSYDASSSHLGSRRGGGGYEPSVISGVSSLALGASASNYGASGAGGVLSGIYQPPSSTSFGAGNGGDAVGREAKEMMNGVRECTMVVRRGWGVRLGDQELGDDSTIANANSNESQTTSEDKAKDDNDDNSDPFILTIIDTPGLPPFPSPLSSLSLSLSSSTSRPHNNSSSRKAGYISTFLGLEDPAEEEAREAEANERRGRKDRKERTQKMEEEYERALDGVVGVVEGRFGEVSFGLFSEFFFLAIRFGSFLRLSTFLNLDFDFLWCFGGRLVYAMHKRVMRKNRDKRD